jgi:hypothetical protein
MDDDKILCPYCSSDGDCQHLLAYYDSTFRELNGGYIYGKRDHEDLINDFFNAYVKQYGFTENLIGIDDNYLEDIWVDVVAQQEYAEFDEMSKTYDASGIISGSHVYLINILDEICEPEYYDFEGGPGQSSLYKINYSENPEKTFKELLLELKATLDTHIKASLDAKQL